MDELEKPTIKRDTSRGHEVNKKDVVSELRRRTAAASHDEIKRLGLGFDDHGDVDHNLREKTTSILTAPEPRQRSHVSSAAPSVRQVPMERVRGASPRTQN